MLAGLMAMLVPAPNLSDIRKRAHHALSRALVAADMSRVSVAIDTGLQESHVSRQLKNGINLYTWLAIKNKEFWREVVMLIREETGLDDADGELPLRDRVAQQEQRLAEQKRQIEELTRLVHELIQKPQERKSA